MHIAFATTTPDVIGASDRDRALHEGAFERAGITLDHCVWWDERVPWQEYDLVVIGFPWDYVTRLEEFRGWLRRMDALGTLRNPASVVEWGLYQRYAAELGAHGVPVIPTRVASSSEEFVDAVGSREGEIVVKPVVSAGSRNTGRFSVRDPRALALAERILVEGIAVQVQPAVASVAANAELSTVLFNGVASHSFRKGALLARGEGHLGGAYDERISPEPPSTKQRQVVEATAEVLSHVVSERFGTASPLLYARVDLVTLDDGPVAALEVELAEPSFFLPVDPRRPLRPAHVATAGRHHGSS
ncbi:MAG TPA: hypothetical protein VFC03_21210 [Acidimicrobiales bacterium]|nr:hypothetical protein [Acidimicrobiales bacterium]